MNSSRTHFGSVALSALLAFNLATPAALAQTSGASTADKDETVYVSLDPSGSASEISVSDLLANEDKSGTVSDVSTLTNIKPSGDDTSIQSQEGSAIVWNADGKKVRYRGTSSSELPVSCSLSFSLDGHDIAASDLVDKSGHVTIRLSYKNNDAHEVTIDGQPQTIYTPFVAMSVLSLKRDAFTNISVSGGRVIDGSDKVTIVGLSFPGLQESLAVQKEDVDIPSALTIEADVDHFALGQVITIVTPELLSDLDTQKLDTSELKDARTKLGDAMDSLASGTSEIHDSMQQLAEGQSALGDGINRFASALEALPDGMQQLVSGADQLATASSTAAQGARELTDASDAVIGGLSLLADKIDGSKGNLQTAEAKLRDAATKLGADEAGIRASGQDEGLLAHASDGLKAMLASSTLSDEEREILKEALAALDAKQQDRQQDDVTQSIEDARQDVLSAHEDLACVTGTLTEAQEVLNASAQGAALVSNGTEELATGLDGIEDGTLALSQGLTEFENTLPQLASGASELKQGSDKLVSGTQAILQGTSSLMSGITELNERGIKKLMSKIDESGVTVLSERLEALSQAASDYQNFSGLAEGQQGSVTFFYKTEPIGE